MAANQQFCLRWNNHQRTLISVFDSLLESGTLVDCTLAAEGQYLKAHKVVLSACSPYLGVLLSSHHEKHPILILKDIKFQELKAMLDYMYRGEVNISQEQLGTFLKAAESLQIKGLTESAGLNPETKDFEERLVKRYDRKCPSGASAAAAPSLPNHSVAARVRSPPSANALTSAAAAAVISEHGWSQKYAATANFRGACSSPPPPARIRDGSLSPTARKRRKQQHPISSSSGGGGCVDEAPLLPISPLIATALNASSTTATTTTTTTSPTTHHSSRGDSGVVENHQDAAAAASSADPLGEAAAANSVTSSNSSNGGSHINSSNSSSNSVSSNGNSANPLSMTLNSIKAEHTDKCNDNETRSTDSGNSSTTTTSSAKVNDLPVVPKSEPKYDDRQSDGEAAYEDSVEEMTLEDEEEEIDETDLSRPGPSHSEDSQNYGSSSYPLSSVNDSASGQLDCQGKSWKVHYLSNWESWSAAYPGIAPIQGSGGGGANNQSFSSGGSPTNMEYAKGVECPDCGRHYKLKSSLRNHQKWECGKEPQFQCPYCNYRAKQKMHVARHIERMHREKLTNMVETCMINNNSINNSNNNNATI